MQSSRLQKMMCLKHAKQRQMSQHKITGSFLQQKGRIIREDNV